jgi:hypothetical protein
MDDAKVCTTCGNLKLLTEFYAAEGMRDGRRNDCKACNLAAKRERYRADPDRDIARVKAWQAENRGRHLANQRARRERPEVKARERDGHLKRKFGITQDDYEVMLAVQGGGCAICGKAPSEARALHVDHDHRSGVVRGLLCFDCNAGIGKLREDPELLRLAAYYLLEAAADLAS